MSSKSNPWENYKSNLQKSMRKMYYMSPKIHGTEMYSHGFLEISGSEYIVVSRIFGDFWKNICLQKSVRIYLSPTDLMDFTDFWRYTQEISSISRKYCISCSSPNWLIEKKKVCWIWIHVDFILKLILFLFILLYCYRYSSGLEKIDLTSLRGLIYWTKSFNLLDSRRNLGLFRTSSVGIFKKLSDSKFSSVWLRDDSSKKRKKNRDWKKCFCYGLWD